MFAWDMVLCGVVGTDVSERPSVSIIRVEQQDERGRWYMIEDRGSRFLRNSTVYRPAPRHIPEDRILIHCCEKLVFV